MSTRTWRPDEMSHCRAHTMQQRCNGPTQCQCHVLPTEPLGLPGLRSQGQEMPTPPGGSPRLPAPPCTSSPEPQQSPAATLHVLNTTADTHPLSSWSDLMVFTVTSEEVEPRPHSGCMRRAEQRFQCKPAWLPSPHCTPFPDSGSCIPRLHLL